MLLDDLWYNVCVCKILIIYIDGTNIMSKTYVRSIKIRYDSENVLYIRIKHTNDHKMLEHEIN